MHINLLIIARKMLQFRNSFEATTNENIFGRVFGIDIV